MSMDYHVGGLSCRRIVTSCRRIVTSVDCHVGGLPRQWFVTNSHHKQLCFSYHPSSSDQGSCYLFITKIIAPRGRLVPTNTLSSLQLHSKLNKARTWENNADHKNPGLLLTSFVLPYHLFIPPVPPRPPPRPPA